MKTRKPVSTATVAIAPPAAKSSAINPKNELLNLRKNVFGMDDQEKSVFAEATSNTIVNEIPKLDACSLQNIARFIDLCTHDCGLTTPAEKFIVDLVNSHYLYGGLTPDAAIEEIESPDGFRIDYDDMIRDATRFRDFYLTPQPATDVAQQSAEAEIITPAESPEDWLTETPEAPTYSLLMTEWQDGSHVQEIDITREEFITLKKHLAKLRGIRRTSTAAA